MADSATISMLNSVPDTDIAQQLVKALVSTDSQNALMTALSVFSTNMLAIASMMLAWHTLVGIVATAKEGKLLGSRWHTIWAPVRVSLGIALLIPGFNGATAGQLLTREVALLANAMASSVWQTYATTLTDTPSSVPTIEDAGGKKLAVAALRKEFCVSALQAISADSGGTNLVPTNISTEMTKSGEHLVQWPASPTSIAVGVISSSTYDFGVSCGKIILPTQAALSNDSGAQAWQQAQIQNISTLLSGIAAAHLATDYVNSQLPGSTSNPPSAETIQSTVESLAKAYDEAQKSAASSYVKQLYGSASSDFQKSVKDEGWVSAGVYWRTLTQYSKTYMDAVVGKASVSDGDTSQLGTDVGQDYSAMSKNFSFVVDRIFPDPATPDIHAVTSAMASATAATEANGGGSGLMEKTTAMITSAIYSATNGFAESVLASSADPIGDMITLGHRLIIGASTMIVGLLGAAVLSGNFLAGLVGGAGVFGVISNIVELVALFIGGIGVLYAYVLPMLPFIYIIMLLVGWVVMIVESIIAVIVWAFLFVRMDGDEMIDNPQRQGVLILFNLLLRPTLGVLALILSMTVLPLLLRVVNRLVIPAFFAAQGTSLVALVGMIASVGVAAFLHYQIITRTLSLITDLPDRVTRWFGLPGEGLGESHHAGQAAGAFTGAALGASRHASDAARRVAQGVAQRQKTGEDGKDEAPDLTASDPSAPRNTENN